MFLNHFYVIINKIIIGRLAISNTKKIMTMMMMMMMMMWMIMMMMQFQLGQVMFKKDEYHN